MSVGVDKDKFLLALGRALAQKIIPNLDDADAKATAESALSLIVRNILTQEEEPAVERARALRLTDEVRAALDEAPGGLDPAQTKRLLAALDVDQVPRAQKSAAASLLQKDLSTPEATRFPVPSADKVTDCLKSVPGWAPGVHAQNVALMSGGNGKQTVSFDRVAPSGRREELVMRRDIPESFNQTTVATEFPILAALHQRGFPVPEPVWLDASKHVLPTAYMVTRRVPGQLAGDGKGAFPGLLAQPVEVVADVLARLHAIDPRALAAPGISDAPWDEASLVKSLDDWETYYRSSIDVPLVAADLAFAWLKRNAAFGLQGPAVVHGEFGFHNLLVCEGRLAAVLDWELAHLGSPIEDLCYVKDQIERYCPFEDFVALYVKSGGLRPPPEALEFYDVMRLARNTALFGASVYAFNKGTSDRLTGTSLSSILYNAYVKRLHAKMATILSERRFARMSGG